MADRLQLLLENGSIIEGFTRGYVPDSPVSGEVVFTTSPVGYVEAITDPSYKGQILVFAFPEIGNYGVNPAWMESSKPQVQAVIANRITDPAGHPGANESLRQFLDRFKVPCIEGVDTRALIHVLRESGTMLGAVKTRAQGFERGFFDPNDRFIHLEVCVKQPVKVNDADPMVVVVDCGVKRSIVQNLVKNGLGVTLVPCDFDFTNLAFDGLFLSNGPGNPQVCTPVIERLPRVMGDRPVFGVCLGQQLAALAVGMPVYKLPYGHRGQNQPCLNLKTGKAVLTSQNHGWAVDAKGMPDEWEVTFVNLNDDSVEGIGHKELPLWTVQFHPEARPGPLDSLGLFREFADRVRLK